MLSSQILNDKGLLSHGVSDLIALLVHLGPAGKGKAVVVSKQREA